MPAAYILTATASGFFITPVSELKEKNANFQRENTSPRTLTKLQATTVYQSQGKDRGFNTILLGLLSCLH